MFPELSKKTRKWKLLKVLSKSQLGADKRVEKKTEMKTTNGK